MGLLGLAQAQTCDYTGKRWKDDETCSGTPFNNNVWVADPVNECIYEYFAPGKYGLISQCSEGTFVWEDYSEDETCTGDKTEYTYASGECTFDYEDDGVKYYMMMTINEEDDKATFAAVAWASLFTAMMVVYV